MKRRWICLALCLAMLLLPVLTGCNRNKKSVEDKVSDAASESAVTLTMWMVTEDPVDAETVSEINKAVNAITKTKYKTRLIVKFFTEAEYRSVLDNTIISYLDTRSSGQTYEDHSILEDDSGDGQKYGINIIKYPDPVLNQVDIIYISGKDMYVEYIENGWLSQLDSELSSSSKKIKEYVNASLLSAAKYIDSNLGINGTYAIPNNHMIGEYTMMLLDRELMDQTSFDSIYKLGQIDGMFNDYVYSYLETVRDGIANGTLAGVLPVAADYETCLNLLAYYWNINPDTLENEEGFSFLGYTYNDLLHLNRGTELKFGSLFEDPAFIKAFLKLNEYRLDGGYFGEENETTKAAMKVVTGDYGDLKSYLADDSAYYPVVLKNPTVLADDVYENMLGVCAYTRNLSRSMQIVTHLNTNAEFRNILQYGVEGFNYKLEYVGQTNDQIVVPIPEHPYHMDVYKSGNVFLTYPTAELTEELWDNGKMQNRDVSGADPLLDVAFSDIANQGTGSGSTASIGSSGYVWDYQTGYTKEILSQQKQLKAWLNACDANEAKGIFTFITYQEDGQNIEYRIFVYNNDTGVENGGVQDEKTGLYIHQISEDESAEGAYNYYFHSSYVGDASAGSSQVRNGSEGLEVVYDAGTATGYELSILEVKGRKSANFNVSFWVKGEKVNLANVKRQNSLITPDLNESETYRAFFSDGIAKTTVATNPVIWNWIKNDCAGAEAGVPQILKSSKVVGTGADAYQLFTFVVYTTGLRNETSVTMHPKGTATDVILDVDFNQSGRALREDDPNYAIWMITVEADPAVETVSLNLVYGDNQTAVVETEAETDPDFIYRGTLDTQLVRDIYELNTVIKMLLDGIDNYADFKTAVEELRILLNPENVAKKNDFVFLQDLVNEMDLSELQYSLKRATSTKTIPHEGISYDDNGEEVYGTITYDTIAGEDYVLLDSPYAVYHSWMVAKKYISK